MSNNIQNRAKAAKNKYVQSLFIAWVMRAYYKEARYKYKFAFVVAMLKLIGEK